VTALVGRHHRARPECSATRTKRADVASRAPRPANHRAQIDQSQRNGFRVSGRNNILDQVPEAVVIAWPRAGRADPEAACEHSDDVRIQQRPACPVCNDQYSVRDVTPYAGKRRQLGLSLWHTSLEARAQLAGQLRQARASVQETKRAEELDDVRFSSGRETRCVWVAVDETREHVRDKVCAGSLQQELSDQDVKRVARLAPGKLPPVLAEPCPHPATRPARVTLAHGVRSVLHRLHRGPSVRRRLRALSITCPSLSTTVYQASAEAHAMRCLTIQRPRSLA
jgi:hypothetical protein